MMQLSPHFSVAEFVRSDTATRLGISNDLPIELLAEARKTAAMLENIRDYLSKLAAREIPIHISSAYRCLAVNRCLKSSDTSDHVKAAAADWTAPDFGSPFDICRVLAPQVGILGIGQLINEFPGAGWVHTSTLIPSKLVNRIITIDHSGTTVGIHA